jgi:ribose 5-phosphate isomerase B
MKHTIVLGADHAGFELKEHIKAFLSEKGYAIIDKGAHSYDEPDDYPNFIIPAAKEVAKSNGRFKGIIFGGSGQGEAIAANRVKGVRAALFYGKDLDIVKLSRTHNNANILSLGARFVEPKEAEEAIMLWLSTSFEGEERHSRRIKKIDDLS